METTCKFDSGSATGNRPLCEADATHVIVVNRSSMGLPPRDLPVCARHIRAARGALGPEALDTREA